MTFGSRACSARLGRTSRRWTSCALAAASLLGIGLASVVQAQGDDPSASRPRSAKRLVRFFDFEEPTNPYPVPAHWFRAQDDPAGVRRPGYPKYNGGAFDKTIAVSGKASVRLPTSGGSTVLRLEAGEIPIFPDADYSVSAKVQTVGLEHARAFLTARLLDQRSNPIPGAEVRSVPVLAPGGWETVQILVPGNSPAAAWLQIDLELLQPKQFEPPPPEAIRKHIVPREDVAGAAYFDDVAVALVPRTKFWAAQASGIFVAPERPTLGMLVRDQGGEELSARVRVLDIDGKNVAEETIKLDPSARASTWTPTLPGYGWYRAILDIDAADISVTRQEVWLCSLPDRLKLVNSASRIRDLARFGIIADDTPEKLLSQIPAIAERIGTRFITIPAFDASLGVDQQRASLAGRSATIEKLLAQGQQVTLTVGDVPPELAVAHVLDATDALGMCEHDPKTWAPFMEPMLDVFGQQILRYQLGITGDTHAMRRDPTLGVETFERSISRLVPGPRILLPWRADHPIPMITRGPAANVAAPDLGGTISPGPLVDELSMVFPLGFAPGAMHDLSLVWRDQLASGNAIGLTVVPELPEIDRYGPKARASELARRVVEFWGAMGAGGHASTPDGTAIWPRIAVDAPWRIVTHADDSDPTLLPGPALAAMSQMAERLAGRRMITMVPGPAGVRAMLLAEPVVGGGDAENAGLSGAGGIGNRPGDTLVRACVVAWADSAEPDRAWVDVYPARDSVEVVDMFGNSTQLAISASGSGARSRPSAQIRVPLTDSPVFIEGVDPYLAQFTSSFKLTPTFIPAIVAEHDMRIEMTNPWPIRITGQIQLKEPESATGAPTPRGMAWTISPNVIEFAIAPGQTTSVPLQLAFGPGQLAGVKDLLMVARVLADRQYPAIRTTTSIEVGLPDLELVPDVQLGPTPSGPDVIVTAAITNRDTKPRTLRLELAAADTPGQQLQISALPPSQTAYKRFVIRDGARLLGGKRVRITLGDDESAARLSKAVMVPKPQ